ncbi:sugar ABC transporter ATP-binding protein [Gallaecimonas xiamenensis]|uniref:ABC transporter-like protein n=1 Tax=Gallaecimonas xiamenensis 3-C-1 TaxID=745411 RepID=K2JBZ1_9GAMM|nr:sugar ABC transporter ATP-binding protein [Gallaecimonas xiamenensis]EKE72327.1 ABC transporter-like protein [Gallaecimonas xiamenensis 3-C-1]
MTEPQPLLALSGIHKAFPGVKALDSVGLRLFAGEVHALLGENGAGKSTLVKVMTGAYQKDEGSMVLAGRPVSPGSTKQAQELGIATVYQEVNLLPNLSVAHNLFLGREPKRWGLIHWAKMREQAKALLAPFELDIDVSKPLNQYSVAVQQLVAIARGVGMNAKVLVLDEPTASLDAGEVAMLFGILNRLKADGIAIVFITHFLDQVYAVSDRITVLRSGTLVGEFLTRELPRAKLIEAMLGAELQEMTASQAVAGGQAAPRLFDMADVSVRHSIEEVSLSVGKGEAVGLAGLLGSGRSEVCRAAFGVDPLVAGQIRLEGAPLKLARAADAIRAGIALCPEDRKADGIIGPLSIRENLVLALQARLGWWRYISPARQQAMAEDFIKAFRIATPNASKAIGELSGGNQQKVILARWLAIQPKLLILDEPTRGIDIGAHSEILKLIKQLCQDGMSLLVASSELEELVAFANRVVVMRDRKKVAELSGEALSPQGILHAIAEA